MRKKILSLFTAVAVCFTTTACSSTPAATPIPTESVEPSEAPVESETPTPEPSETARTAIREYKDFRVVCSYDSSILVPSFIPSNEDLLHGLNFNIEGEFYDEMNGDFSPTDHLAVITQSLPRTPVMAYSTDYIEKIFSNSFSSVLEPDIGLSSIRNIDGTTECTATLKDNTLLKCKLIAYTDEPAITLISLRLSSDTPKEFKEAVINCYNSIRYKRDNNLLTYPDCNWIKEGELFDSITSIDDNIQLGEYKNDNRLEIAIHLDAKSMEEDVVRFFSVMDKICVDCNSLLESYSNLQFKLITDDPNILNTWITSLMYKKFDNSNIFYLNKPVTLVNEYASIVDDVYSTYQPSNDNFRKSEKRLDDLKKEYNLD